MTTPWRIAHSLALHAGLTTMLASGCSSNPPPQAAGTRSDSVAVGYGTQSKDDVSGSVASLSDEQLDGVRAARVEELLQGRVAGVQVFRRANGDLAVRIRGAGSILGNGGEPLYVIDGVPIVTGGFGGALAGIPPADIHRIDVLKDAGATAIYGVRGANGVVLVTTKRRR